MVLSPLFQETTRPTKTRKTDPPEHLSPHPDEAPPPDKIVTARQLEKSSSAMVPRKSLGAALSEGIGWLQKPWEPLCETKSHIYE